MTLPPDPELPAAHLQAWAASATSPFAAVVAVGSLSQGGRNGPWRLRIEDRRGTVEAVLKVEPPTPEAVRRLRTSVAALEVARAHGLAAPRVIAHDLTGELAGRPAVLTTFVAGSSAIVRRISAERLRRLGRVAATLHAVPGTPSTALPRRARSLDGYDLQGDDPTDPLLERGREVVAAGPPVTDEPVGFVHGDLWQGNTMWVGDQHTGTIDWDFAGFGPAGIDLGSLRCDVAVLHGVEAAELVLAGWQEAAGSSPTDLAWWDVVAGIATPDDLRGWLPNFHAQGRTDLDLVTVTERRDRFLREALDRLG
jgi:aminoglycoside phosphotransferase (APT) family kinase protein